MQRSQGELRGAAPEAEYEVWADLITDEQFSEKVTVTTSVQGKAYCVLPIIECSSGGDGSVMRARVNARCRMLPDGPVIDLLRLFVKYCCR